MSHEAHSHTSHHASPELRTLTGLSGKLLALGLIVGVVGIGGAYAASKGDMHRFGLAYLTGWSFFLTVSLGALFFVNMQHLVRAGWSVTIRRLAEIMAANLLTLGILAIPIVLSVDTIYTHWAHPVGHDHLIEHKAAWLNVGFFKLRIGIYLLIWIGLAWWFYSKSLKQDRTGDVGQTATMQRYSGLGIVLFSLSINWGAFDILMSLDPHWYSTVFGVYIFTGANIAFFATLTLMLRFLHGSGRLKQSVSLEHYHDLGKYMFGFTIFWGYIGFSQYMLIWYGNIPEETQWYARRGAATHDFLVNPWSTVALTLLFAHFFIPFLGQISRWAKRWINVLTFWAVWMFVMHFVDLYWIVMPENTPGVGEPHTDELPMLALIPAALAWVGVGGLWLAGFAAIAGGRSLVPTQDPRLEEAVTFQNY